MGVPGAWFEQKDAAVTLCEGSSRLGGCSPKQNGSGGTSCRRLLCPPRSKGSKHNGTGGCERRGSVTLSCGGDAAKLRDGLFTEDGLLFHRQERRVSVACERRSCAVQILARYRVVGSSLVKSRCRGGFVSMRLCRFTQICRLMRSL